MREFSQRGDGRCQGGATSLRLLFGSLFVPATCTVIRVVSALFPKTIPGEESLAYFGEVAKAKSAAEYRKRIRALLKDEWRRITYLPSWI